MIQDLLHSLRQLRRRPAFAAAAILTLATGLSVNTVAFTVVNGLLFKNFLHTARPGVGRIVTTPAGDDGGYASLPEYERFAAAARGALDLAAEGRMSVGWQHRGGTNTAWALMVTDNYFSMVDVQPLTGQLVVSRAGREVPSVVIGERFWREKLGEPPLSGLTLQLNRVTVAVAGILPAAYTGPAGIYSPDVWLPLDELAAFNASPALRERDERWLFAFGQLAPGVTAAEVDTRVRAAATLMAGDWPQTHGRRGAEFRLMGEANPELSALSTAATVGLTIIGLVLLLACFNVANLLLARAADRERDLAVRAALGASSWRLVRFVLVDGLVIATIAGAVAVLLAIWTRSLVGAFAIPIEQPQHIDLSVDWRVLTYTAVLALLAGVLPGVWPALSAARVDVARVLGAWSIRVSGGGAVRLRRWLVGAQIAGSTAFLVVGALLIQSYGWLSAADLGLARDRLLVAEFDAVAQGYNADRAEQHAQQLGERVRALPGVLSVALADRMPFFIGYDRRTATASGTMTCQLHTCPQAATVAATPEYFATLGITLVGGRTFGAGAVAEVVINQPLARLHWPDGRGLGETLRLGARQTPVTVVGVTATTRTRTLLHEAPTMYVPLTVADVSRGLALAVRSASAPDALVGPVRAAAAGVDTNVALGSVQTMAGRADLQLWPYRTASWLVSLCAFIAGLLAVTGLTGVVVHDVSRRMREFGVRMSLGAAPRDLAAAVVGDTVRIALPGVVVGGVVAMGLTGLLRSRIAGLNLLDPSLYLSVAALLVVVVVTASLGPALRAARVDPATTLRSE